MASKKAPGKRDSAEGVRGKDVSSAEKFFGKNALRDRTTIALEFFLKARKTGEYIQKHPS